MAHIAKGTGHLRRFGSKSGCGGDGMSFGRPGPQFFPALAISAACNAISRGSEAFIAQKVSKKCHIDTMAPIAKGTGHLRRFGSKSGCGGDGMSFGRPGPQFFPALAISAA